MWYVLISILLFFLVPGAWVHIQSIRFLTKNGEKDAIWQSLSPLPFFLIVFVAIPLYSFTFFSLLLVPAVDRTVGIQTAYKEMKAKSDTTAVKLSVVHGLAGVFGVKLE